MAEEKKKRCGVGKFLLAIVLLAAATYGGWFAYAKATGRPDC